ncbi:hypothetical protein DCS_04056 [Drechmeria coniospora]|uniref:Uncharacterized protein n=1 Tax=Drechmeria coniospora TaxID=98403 RepID=A0A151GIZ0_DRECN|nr:hypothetical protein DCS_04056 [Drechmeria coniospora]KYK57049.1 hypothetical protein DCS_04056 [Drechmeria coniospora]
MKFLANLLLFGTLAAPIMAAAVPEEAKAVEGDVSAADMPEEIPLTNILQSDAAQGIARGTDPASATTAEIWAASGDGARAAASTFADAAAARFVKSKVPATDSRVDATHSLSRRVCIHQQQESCRVGASSSAS